MNFKRIACQMAFVSLGAGLAACGGGGGGDSNPSPQGESNTSPQAVASTGTVSAMFVAGSVPRYFAYGMADQSTGALSHFTQDSNGAMTVIDSYTLTGSPIATKEINGDANYAQGRWVQGTVTSEYETRVLDGKSYSAQHYLVLNSLAVLPESGVASCDGGRFTAPTWIAYAGDTTLVRASAYSGTATGTAQVSFTPTGANLSVAVTVDAGGATAQTTFSGSVASPTSTIFTGHSFGGGTGGLMTIGDGGNGSFIVGGPYSIVLSNGAEYRGIATFRCTLI